jgi:hypothetical protein
MVVAGCYDSPAKAPNTFHINAEINAEVWILTKIA